MTDRVNHYRRKIEQKFLFTVLMDKGEAKMISTKGVIEHHLKCFGEGDLNGILSDYLPNAILFTPERPLKGIDAIKTLFQAMIAEFSKPGAVFSMKQLFVEGDHAYILWTAETVDNVYEFATDTFVVQDGKIVAQSFASKIISKHLASLEVF